MKKIIFLTLSLIIIVSGANKIQGQGDGLLIKDGKRLFPLGWYHMPKEDDKLKELASAGFNIIKCSSRNELDRAHKQGLMGWMPLKFQDGATEEYKKLVNSVVEHPALALWEGPDEIIWNFTAWSRLFRVLKVHEKPDAWWDQTPGAVAYAKEQAAKVIPNIRQSISYIREVDRHNRQVWINEASRSDMSYVRQYLDCIDITGCDKYPISGLRRDTSILKVRADVDEIRFYTQRYDLIGKGKPVYMILQAFSWPELGGQWAEYKPAYPSFQESRYMAYISIAYGAKGIYYYGGSYTKQADFIQSIFAVTSELSAIQPFLISPQQNAVNVYSVVDNSNSNTNPGKISCIARQYGRDWLIVVINESDEFQMGVTVKNLTYLNGQKLTELYGSEEVTISNEEISTRLHPREVKVFATGKKWETAITKGRDYQGK